jgi:hypothetical protein
VRFSQAILGLRNFRKRVPALNVFNLCCSIVTNSYRDLHEEQGGRSFSGILKARDGLK